MDFQDFASPVDRWFAETATAMMYVSPRELGDVPTEQSKLERELERPIRVWEVLVLHERLTVRQTEHILSGLGRFSGTSDDVSMLGRVLIEVGYARAEQVEDALILQSEERRRNTWRPLGQILVEERVLSRVDLAEALDVLEQRRRMRIELIEAEKAEQEEAASQ